MAMEKLIKVDEKTHTMLIRRAGKMQQQSGRRVTVAEAIRSLLKEKRQDR